MKEHVEKILEKQLQLLSEASVRNQKDYKALYALSISMSLLVKFVYPSCQEDLSVDRLADSFHKAFSSTFNKNFCCS